MIASKVVVLVRTTHSIAKAAAEKFCDQGYRVVLWEDISTPVDESILESCKLRKGSCVIERFDFKNTDNFEKAAVHVIKNYGRIDILVNNPKLSPVSKVPNLSTEAWHETIDANLSVFLHSISVVAPFMQEQKVGSIINCCLPLRIHDSLTDRHYDGIREGVKGITQLWARELGQSGINVNTVIPGYIEEDNLPLADSAELTQFRLKIPVRRFARAIDIVNAYSFLVTDEASYITGTELVIDGGVRI
jgi:3-oxoacyl-[acyl-carrier protein] reductase